MSVLIRGLYEWLAFMLNVMLLKYRNYYIIFISRSIKDTFYATLRQFWKCLNLFDILCFYFSSWQFYYWIDSHCYVLCLIPLFSSPEPTAHRWAYRILMVRRPSVRRRPSLTISNFFSETTWRIKAKFYLEPPWVGGNESLFATSESHDQDGRHAHIW